MLVDKILPNYSSDCKIVVYEGDCLDFLKQIPDSSIKLAITSPPYNIGKEYESRDEFSNYLNSQKPLLVELKRIISDSGHLCWQTGNYVQKGEIFPLDVYYYAIIKDLGFKLRNRIIWHFGHGLHATKRFSGRYETILWFSKTDHFTFNLDNVRIPQKYPGKTSYKGDNRGKPSSNPLGKNPSDIWEIIAEDWEEGVWDIPNVKSNHPEKTIHPCQFPIELVERCILALTNVDDYILDPYAGVGSTLIAGIKNDRRVIGCEKEKEYIHITKNRIQMLYNNELPMRKLGAKIHTPTGREKVTQVPKEWGKDILEK